MWCLKFARDERLGEIAAYRQTCLPRGVDTAAS